MVGAELVAQGCRLAFEVGRGAQYPVQLGVAFADGAQQVFGQGDAAESRHGGGRRWPRRDRAGSGR